MPRTTILASALFSLAAPLLAQVDYGEAGRAYVQNFDLPAAVGNDDIAWEDNVTFPGWFAAFYDGRSGLYAPPENILPTSGPGRLSSAFYLYRAAPTRAAGGAGPASTRVEAALGTQATDQRCPSVGAGGVFYGVALTNRTGKTLDTLRLSYRVELWRLAAAATAQPTLTASFSTDAKRLSEGTWTLIPGAAYTTHRAGDGSLARAIDGNAPENATPVQDLVVTSLGLAPGRTLWVRWFDVNNSGADHGVGLDDVSITLSP